MTSRSGIGDIETTLSASKNCYRSSSQIHFAPTESAVYMSGGLDSTAVAATARHMCSATAFTIVFDSLIPDEERHYSTIAARALQLPIRHLAADDYDLLMCWDGDERLAAEPNHDRCRLVGVASSRAIAVEHRVALNCEGPDSLFHSRVAAVCIGSPLSLSLYSPHERCGVSDIFPT